MIKWTFLAVFLTTIFVATALASDISGRYSLQGTDPGNGGTYHGEVLVVRKDDVYVVAWRIGDQRFVGTGLRVDDGFAVVYESRDTPAGLVLYKILPDGSMTGIYTNLGQTRVGTETWKPE